MTACFITILFTTTGPPVFSFPLSRPFNSILIHLCLNTVSLLESENFQLYAAVVILHRFPLLRLLGSSLEVDRKSVV